MSESELSLVSVAPTGSGTVMVVLEGPDRQSLLDGRAAATALEAARSSEYHVELPGLSSRQSPYIHHVSPDVVRYRADFQVRSGR